MPAFEVNNMNSTRDPRGAVSPVHAHEGVQSDAKMLKEECVISFKVYDSCRQQDCLELARARKQDNSIIAPHECAESVTIEDLRICSIEIVSKKPSMCGKGFWDITIRYTFEYTLVFEDVTGTEVDREEGAVSSFIKKVTLFGSESCGDLVLSSDLPMLDTSTDGKPFVLVEAKAVALGAEIRFDNGDDGLKPVDVRVTIGLFTVIKVFRLVNLLIESTGFGIPEECPEIEALRPCELFDSMDFPIDIFSPPQKPEFYAGVSANIPAKGKGKIKGCEEL